MSGRDLAAAAVVIWLVGALVGWCLGWAARGEQNRARLAARARELERTRTQLAQAYAELDAAHAHWQAQRVAAPPAGTVVAVNLGPLLPVAPSWTAGHAPVLGPPALPVLPPRAPPGVG